MSSFSITKKELVEIKDSKGVEIRPGDAILLRIRTEDVVCRFSGLSNGYFVTTTLDKGHENKYRMGSIEECTKIQGIKEYEEEK